MKHILIGGILLLSTLALESPAAYAQEEPHNPNFWLSLGIGGSFAEGGTETDAGGGGAIRAALTVQHEALVFTTRWTLNTGGSHPSGGGFSGPTNDQFYDVGLLGGYSFNPESNWQVILSAGVGLVGGERVISAGSGGGGGMCFGFFCGSGQVVESRSISGTFGVPVEFGIYGNRGSFALAIIGHANVNREATFGGVTINLVTGVLGQ